MYGIGLYALDENWDDPSLMAFGHYSPMRFVAACNAYARREWGWCHLLDSALVSSQPATLSEALKDVYYEWGHYIPDPDPEEYGDDYDWHVIRSREPLTEEYVPIMIWRS